MSQTFSNPQVTIERIPITLPIDEVVTRLNQAAPTTLRGYPYALDHRLDDSLTYAGAITVHPIVVRSPLGRQRNIAEYQVHQTHHGVTVLVRLVGDVDLEALRREISTALAEVGMVDPEVVLVPVERITRQASGKVQRIVPLDAI